MVSGIFIGDPVGFLLLDFYGVTTGGAGYIGNSLGDPLVNSDTFLLSDFLISFSGVFRVSNIGYLGSTGFLSLVGFFSLVLGYSIGLVTFLGVSIGYIGWTTGAGVSTNGSYTRYAITGVSYCFLISTALDLGGA